MFKLVVAAVILSIVGCQKHGLTDQQLVCGVIINHIVEDYDMALKKLQQEDFEKCITNSKGRKEDINICVRVRDNRLQGVQEIVDYKRKILTAECLGIK
jgi:hypothetical protein